MADWWNNLDPGQTFLGVKLGHVLAGAIGGIIRTLVKPRRTMLQNILGAITGVFVASYGTPILSVLADHYGLDTVPDESLEGALGFLLGLAGMSLCEAILNKISSWGKSKGLLW